MAHAQAIQSKLLENNPINKDTMAIHHFLHSIEQVAILDMMPCIISMWLITEGSDFTSSNLSPITLQIALSS